MLEAAVVSAALFVDVENPLRVDRIVGAQRMDVGTVAPVLVAGRIQAFADSGNGECLLVLDADGGILLNGFDRVRQRIVGDKVLDAVICQGGIVELLKPFELTSILRIVASRRSLRATVHIRF